MPGRGIHRRPGPEALGGGGGGGKTAAGEDDGRAAAEEGRRRLEAHPRVGACGPAGRAGPARRESLGGPEVAAAAGGYCRQLCNAQRLLIPALCEYRKWGMG